MGKLNNYAKLQISSWKVITAQNSERNVNLCGRSKQMVT